MSASFPAIKTFYSPISTPKKQQATLPPSLPTPGDGFTSSELARDLHPSPDQWSTTQGYTELRISALSPGPRRATFTCRVINIYDQSIESKMPQSAKGCLKVLVKDDTATILIKLWYVTKSYELRLGTLLTCWTTHIHSTSSLATVNETVILPSSPIVTSIFPERDGGCHIQIHDEEGRLSACCRTPLGYFSGDPLPGLMSLDQYMNGSGNEVPEARLLVCVVAIGEPTTVTTRTSTQFLTLSIGITDASTTATLSLSLPLHPSALTWTKTHTILLLSFPKLRAGRISTTPRSHIEIDPAIPLAHSLRKHIQRENSPINQPFLSELFDIDAIESSPQRLQFTFATLAEFIDAGEDEVITGYISVVLSQINLMYLFTRKQVFSMECCDMPVYSNNTTRKCGQCGKKVDLRVNPNLVGCISDESGGVGCALTVPMPVPSFSKPSPKTNNTRKQHSRILWSDEAWCQLLGREKEELAQFCREDVGAKTKSENGNMLRYLEGRLCWMRVVLLVGWTGEEGGGRLAVLRVVA